MCQSWSVDKEFWHVTMPLKVQQIWYDAIWNMPYEICHMKYAIWNMPYEICDLKYAMWNMQYAICCCHNYHKLYAMENGNMLFTIYNVQYLICNLSVSFVKYLINNCLSSLIFFTFETLLYTFISGYWLKFHGLFFTLVLCGVFQVLKSFLFLWKLFN